MNIVELVIVGYASIIGWEIGRWITRRFIRYFKGGDDKTQSITIKHIIIVEGTEVKHETN